MGQENRFLNEEFNHYGPCLILVKDTDKTASRGEPVYHGLGRTGPFNWTPEVETVQRSHWVRGEMVETGQRISRRSSSGSFSYMELNPNTMQLLYGDKDSTQTETGPRIRHFEFEDILYRKKSTGEGIQKAIPHASGFASASRLPEFVSPAAVVSATGGSGFDTAGNPDYYLFFVPVFLHPTAGVEPATDGSDICDAANLDINWCFGTPNSAGVTADMANATDKITCSGTAHGKDAASPDFVAAFINTTDTIVGSVCVGTKACVSGAFSALVIIAPTGGDTYVASTGIKFYTVTGTHDSPTYTAMTIATDIQWDSALAEYYLPDDTDADATTGVNIVARYFHVEPYSVQNTLGPTGLGADYRELLIICLEPQEDGGNPVYPSGIEVSIHRADLGGISAGLRLGSDGFYEGDDVSFRCLADPANGNNFGTIRSLSNSHRNYIQQFE